MNNTMIFKNKKPLLVFLLPAFAFMGLFLYYPFVMNISNSFQNITQLGSPAKGMNAPFYQNYVELIQDPLMGVSLKNTFIMMFATIVFQVGIALVLALMVDSIKKGSQFFRIVYFFPIVISATALGLMFNLIFLYNGGMVNQFVALFGTEAIDWKDEAHAMFTMMLPVVWQYVGYYFVILITGLNNISTDIYEAAEIDGARGLKRIRFITLPLLRNTLCTCLTLSITGALKVFDLPWTMFPNGMPNEKTYLTGTYMYYQTFSRGNVDYGSAIAVVIAILGVVLAQLANVFFKEQDY